VCELSETSAPDFVSVIVPTYNGSRFVEGCVASLLHINFPKDRYEVIVVDDGSTDDTVERVRKYPVRVVRHETNRGMSAARNSGVAAARGKLIAMTDDDAVVPNDWVDHIIRNFGPQVGAVGGRDETFPCSELFERISGAIEDVKCFRRCYGQKAVYLMRGVNCTYLREALQGAGGFDQSVISCNETDLLFRILKSGYEIIYDPSIVVYHHRRSSITAYVTQYIRNGRGDFCYTLKNWRFQATYGRLLPPVLLVVIGLLGVLSSLSTFLLRLSLVMVVTVFAYVSIQCAIYTKRIGKWTWFLPLIAIYSLRNICLGVGFLAEMLGYVKRAKIPRRAARSQIACESHRVRAVRWNKKTLKI